MIGKIISHYKILEKLPTASDQVPIAPGQVGEGGMGEVYLALSQLTTSGKFIPLIKILQTSKK